MDSDVLIVASVGRHPRIDCRGGIAARHTGPDTVHLVSAAATPLGGDVIRIRVVVEPGALLHLRTVAATLALPGRDVAESHMLWTLDVAGELDLDPQPTVVAAHARHVSATTVTLADGARIAVRESVQIGRAGERQGFWSGSLRADVGATPLLRHRVELGAGSVTDDVLDSPLAYIGEFHYPDPDVATTGLTLPLAAGGCISTWQGQRLEH
ncbi:urease accessory protein [Mycobacterium sp. CBMA 234]|uniref:urease accessory protein UreD n=1 Tax=Mycolicibacterium sp. CBMA 234 TaxID=1918495 RepID=UPI0012DFAF01|nr:urease accessory protein UreD [Mycolicibacterium sp. CBMA 234]MUL65394.1 urease accessory protein [Mycolicibacterium sp. CBMA 234]